MNRMYSFIIIVIACSFFSHSLLSMEKKKEMFATTMPTIRYRVSKTEEPEYYKQHSLDPLQYDIESGFFIKRIFTKQSKTSRPESCCLWTSGAIMYGVAFYFIYNLPGYLDNL